MPIMPLNNSYPRILVLGIGNPILSDDSVGLRVASEIKKEIKGVNVKTSSLTGLNIVELILDYDAVIIIDAICTGGKVGEIHRLSMEDFPRSRPVTPHNIGLIEAINIGRIILGSRVPEKIIIYAIEVEEVSTFFERPSRKVEAVVPRIVELIKREIEKILVESNKI